MLQEARLEKGMTQEELAEKSGTTKSYISKIENDVKEVRISTLQKIVETGLGGQVQITIKLKKAPRVDSAGRKKPLTGADEITISEYVKAKGNGQTGNQ